MRIKQEGFSIIELIVALAGFSLLLTTVASFIISLNRSNAATTADREVADNARRAMDAITSEVRAAKGIYIPTTSASQLSLVTSRYLPVGETYTYIDFFLCGSAICLKKESQSPVSLTSGTVQVTSLQFTLLQNASGSSVKVSIAVQYGDPSQPSSINLSSTALVRSQ